ncbi:hypothetical protein LJC46_08250 [Desulfovibrio sp. OttesenSCG-928-G15]|nr:hypothetical protein [Desulfovibrio sp. OttesenSCG-928-G15]
MPGTVISCFDYTTTMVRPWADAGYTCYCVDLQHPAGEHREGNIIKVGADMLDWLPPRGEISFAAFFPPCTDVAVSGARWFQDKGLGALSGAIRLFYQAIRIAEWTGAPYMIENPVSTVSSYWRKPDHTFNPCDYAGYPGGEDDLYTKRTCLWTGGGFVMPDKRPMPPEQGSRMHLLPPSEDRANLRAATPAGFARAVFEANAKVAVEAAM